MPRNVSNALRIALEIEHQIRDKKEDFSVSCVVWIAGIRLNVWSLNSFLANESLIIKSFWVSSKTFRSEQSDLILFNLEFCLVSSGYNELM